MGKLRRDYNDSFVKGSELNFEEWLEFIRLDFSEVNWFDERSDLLKRVCRLLRSPDLLVLKYTEKELNELLWRLTGETGFFDVIFDPLLALPARLDCASAIAEFYEYVFEIRCSPCLSHGVKSFETEPSPLNSICYMFWDVFPHWGAPERSECREVDQVLLGTMEKALRLQNIACQESALHGLGHWHAKYAVEVEQVIDQFLAAQPDCIKGLKDYALQARCGCVN